jgi:hypothetical protein
MAIQSQSNVMAWEIGAENAFTSMFFLSSLNAYDKSRVQGTKHVIKYKNPEIVPC